MNIGLIGYGKMGKAIEELGKAAGLTFTAIVDKEDDLQKLVDHHVEVAIEFTQPTSAVENIRFCLEHNIKVVSGTTGWLDKLPEIQRLCEEKKGTFLYASNFSVGVNLFFEFNEWLAQKMSKLPFAPSITEVHHTEKKDSPSGTALSLAEGIMAKQPEIKAWTNQKSTDPHTLGILSERKPHVPGTHTITYENALEKIEITHTAHHRNVFAEGVVKVAQWIHSQQGFLTMTDFINAQ